MNRSRRLLCVALTCLGLGAAAPAAGASTLAKLMDTADGAARPVPPCLVGSDIAEVPVTRPVGRCAADIVARLYLGLLRDRDRLRLMEDCAEYYRQWLQVLQPRLERGGEAPMQSLMAEIERKRCQRYSAEIARDIQQAEAFFRQIMKSDPAGFDNPKDSGSALPVDETGALAVLSARPDIPDDERAAAETALRLAWLDHETARRKRPLLEDRRHFAQQVLGTLEQQFEVAGATFGDIRDAVMDLVTAREELISAQAQELALKVRILELLQRRDALR